MPIALDARLVDIVLAVLFDLIGPNQTIGFKQTVDIGRSPRAYVATVATDQAAPLAFDPRAH